MDFDKVIAERRSIRSYDSDKKVTKEQVEEIINAANLAPSWKNKQTSRYHVVMSQEKKDILKSCMPEYNAKNVQDAPAIVITTYVKNIVGFDKEGNPDNELGNGWGIYDLGLHNQTFVLKAKEMGLDTLIMGLRDADKIREAFNIPEEEVIVSVIGLGYAAVEGKMPPRKPVEEISKFY